MRHKKHIALALAGALAIGLVTRTSWSEEKPAMPAGGPDAAMMAEMMKMQAPGPQQAQLKKLVGRFTASVAMRMTPDAPEMTSTGETQNTMIMNDRILQGNYTGDMMGMTFTGINFCGYDNLKKKWQNIWLDNMNTGMMSSEGDADASGKVVTFSGEMLCPMDGQLKPMKYREVMTITDDDHFQIEMYHPGPDGKEFKAMTIKYARAN